MFKGRKGQTISCLDSDEGKEQKKGQDKSYVQERCVLLYVCQRLHLFALAKLFSEMPLTEKKRRASGAALWQLVFPMSVLCRSKVGTHSPALTRHCDLGNKPRA